MPKPITARMTATLITTITAFTRALSEMPRISSSEIATMTNTAGRLNRPVAVLPSASLTLSNGEASRRGGR